MTFPIRELQPINRNSFGSAPALPEVEESGLSGVAQALTELRDQDPAFNKVVSIKRIDRGVVVATADDLAQKMYVLMSGKVNMVCTNHEGRRLVITTLQPGAIFGEGALDGAGDPSIFVEASEKATLWVIPAGEARRAAMQYPILSWGLLQTYGERLLQVENSLEDVAYKKLPERLAMLLLDLSDGEDGLIQGVSHQALADHLGTYRETVERDSPRVQTPGSGKTRLPSHQHRGC